MASMGLYAFVVILVAFLIGEAINYSASHFAENLRKLIIVLSLFLFLGICMHPGDKE